MTVMQTNPGTIGVSSHLRGSVRPILVWPNQKLHQPCEDVTVFDDELGQLLMDMCYTMDSGNGIGLAAPQIGVLKNVVTFGTRMQYALEDEGTTPTQYGNSYINHFVMINPRIKSSKETMMYEEGCLSVPGYFEQRKRSRTVVVEFQTPYGRWRSAEYQGLEAFAIQHEIDHLNGKLFIDDLSRLKKDRVKKKIKKALKDPLYPVVI